MSWPATPSAGKRVRPGPRDASQRGNLALSLCSFLGRFAMLAAVLVLLEGSAIATEPAPALPAPAQGPPSGDAPAPRVEITRTSASWDNLSDLFLSLTPGVPFGENSVFVVSGELRNHGKTPLAWVLLRFELLDEKGKVLHDIEGYNMGAEKLRPDEEGHVGKDKVVPIPGGATDRYRMLFFPEEVPRFASHRVRVVEAHETVDGPAVDLALPAARP